MIKAQDLPGGSDARRRRLILSGCVALLGAMGWIDYITGYELGFSVFYSVPVGLAAWSVGRWPAMAVSLGGTVAWYLADSYAGQKYSSPFSFWWNNSIHFLGLAINAITIAKIKSDLDQRHTIAAELDRARTTLRALAARLPACPVCGEPRAEVPDRAHTKHPSPALRHPELETALCPACRSTPGCLREEPPASRSAQADVGGQT